MKKLVSLVATLMMCLAFALPALANVAPAASQQVDAVETALYGTTQKQSLLDRTAGLEDDLFGTTNTEHFVLDRVQGLYDYVCGTGSAGEAEASFMERLNAVDSRFNDRISYGPAKTRIENLETTIFGQTQPGSLNERLNRLVHAAYADGIVPVAAATLPKDSLIKIEFTAPVSSKKAQVGDPIHFRVADNLYVNDVLVIAKGASGVGKVKKIVPPRSFGRDARIDMEFIHVYGVDGREVPVYIGKLAKQEAKTVAGAAGASIGGMIVLGPIGAVGGAFVTGQSIVIPEGSITYVQVTQDTPIKGIVYQPAGAPAAQG